MKMINSAVLRGLIDPVYLNGINHEAVLTILDGVAQIQTVDASNCFFVYVDAEVDILDSEYGITELKILSKVLNDNVVDACVVVEKGQQQWLEFILKNKNKNKFKMLLSPVEQISTFVSDSSFGADLLANYEIALELDAEKIQSIMYFLKTTKPVSVVASLDVNGEMCLRSSADASIQFNVELGELDLAMSEAIEIELYTKHFQMVLTYAIKNKEEPIEIALLDEQHPVLLLQENKMWGFSSINKDNI